jgi:hypothetical protein
MRELKRISHQIEQFKVKKSTMNYTEAVTHIKEENELQTESKSVLTSTYSNDDLTDPNPDLVLPPPVR